MKKLIIIFAALAMVAAFTASAMAEASLYGSARFNTYNVHTDKEWNKGTFSDNDTQWRMGNLSRFGAIFKGDTVGGRFEIDARTNQPDSNTTGASGINENIAGSGGNLRLRLLYGTWNFGSGELLIGQNYPLYNFAISGIAFTTGGLQPYGGVAYGDPRVSQIRFTFGNFKVAFLTPYTKHEVGTDKRATNYVSGPQLGSYTIGNPQPTDVFYNADTDSSLPKIEVEYDLKLDPAAFQLMAGWQSYDAVNAADNSKSVSSWVIAGSGKAHFGPAYVNLALSYRVNGGNYGVWTAVNENATYVNGDFQDTKTFGGVAALGFKVNDMITLEASAGYLSADYDNQGSREDTARSYGFLAQIHLAPGVMIQPEVVVLDKDKVKSAAGVETEQGKETAIGVWWKIDFK
jgi:hypothetical protein